MALTLEASASASSARPQDASSPEAMGGRARWSRMKRRCGRACAVGCRGRQLAGPHEQVEGEAPAADRGEPAPDVRAGQPPGIALRVDPVPQADEEAAARP